MNNYLVILFGSALGMLLLISVYSVIIQKGSKYALGFIDAFKVYTTKYTGPLVVGGLVIMIAMFILPNIIAVASAETGGKYQRILEQVITWLRVYSVALGVLAQGIGFLIVRKGDRYLKIAESIKLTELEKNAA